MALDWRFNEPTYALRQWSQIFWRCLFTLFVLLRLLRLSSNKYPCLHQLSRVRMMRIVLVEVSQMIRKIDPRENETLWNRIIESPSLGSSSFESSGKLPPEWSFGEHKEEEIISVSCLLIPKSWRERAIFLESSNLAIVSALPPQTHSFLLEHLFSSKVFKSHQVHSERRKWK